MTREEVLKEYAYTRIDNDLIAWENEPYTAWHTDAMADEIVRLRTQLAELNADRDLTFRIAEHNGQEAIKANAILAALREPSEAVLLAAARFDTLEGLRAAVAAAEREVES